MSTNGGRARTTSGIVFAISCTCAAAAIAATTLLALTGLGAESF